MGQTSKHGFSTDDATIMNETSLDLRGLTSSIKSFENSSCTFPPAVPNLSLLEPSSGKRSWAEHGKIVWKSNRVAQICRMKSFDIDLSFELC